MSKFYGTVTCEVDGTEYRLVLDFNAVCHVENVLGRNFFQMAEEWETPGAAPSATELRALVHAAMLEHHPDATAREAGRVLSQGVDVFRGLMASAMKGMAAQPGKKKRAAAR